MRYFSLATCSLMLLMASCRSGSVSVEKSSDVEKAVISYREFTTIDTMTLPIPRESICVSSMDSISRLETSVAISIAKLGKDGTILHELHNKVQNCTIYVPSKTIIRDTIKLHQVNTSEVSKEKQVGTRCGLMRLSLYTLLVAMVSIGIWFLLRFLKGRFLP